MTYKEKINFANKGVEYLNKGNSLEEYELVLKGSGYYDMDVMNVVSSIKNILSEKYIDEFVKLLENDNLVFDKLKYPELDKNTFHHIEHKAIDRIIEYRYEDIEFYLEKGYKPEEIIPSMVDKFLSEEKASEFIDEYYKKNDLVKPQQRPVLIAFGLFSIFTGVFWVHSIVGIIGGILHGLKLITKSSRKSK